MAPGSASEAAPSGGASGGRTAATRGSENALSSESRLACSTASRTSPRRMESEFGATEELWFPLWEFGGAPWDKPEGYARWSPSNYVKVFHTPTLVIHGELDFRVPYNQGLELFTALQLQKVPSKLLVFPDEGHWVLKPQNSILWYRTFIDWLDSWVKRDEVKRDEAKKDEAKK